MILDTYSSLESLTSHPSVQLSLYKESYDHSSEYFLYYYILTWAKNKPTLGCAKDCNFYGNTVDWFSVVTDHYVDGPRLSEYRKTFGQRSSLGGIIRKATRLSPSWRIKHTYYVHGYYKQNVCYVVFKPFINLCLQLPRLRFKDWETIKTSSLIRYYRLLRYSQDSERQNYLDVPLNETSLCLL